MRSIIRSAGRIAITFASLVAVVSVAACGSSGTERRAGEPASRIPITIGFSPPTLAAPALKGLADGVQGYAGSKGHRVRVADPKGDPATQVQQLLGWIRRGEVDAVWTIPVSAGPMRRVLDEAQKRQVPVLAAGVPKDFGHHGPAAGISFSRVDNDEYGRRLGGLIADCVNQRLRGEASVILLVEPPGVSSQGKVARDAFAAGLAERAPRARIVAELNSHDDRLKSQQGTASALQAHPNANALAGFNDESTLGGLGALERAGKRASSLCVAGGGGNDEAKAAVRSGRLYGKITIEFERDLRTSVDLLAEMAADPSGLGVRKTTPISEYRG